MSTPENDNLRDLIAKQPAPGISDDFVARTVAVAREVEQDPAEDNITRGPWLKFTSLAAAAAVILAVSLNALLDTSGKPDKAIVIEEAEEIDLAILVADAELPEDRKDMQLMLVLEDDVEISDEDLLAFAL